MVHWYCLWYITVMSKRLKKHIELLKLLKKTNKRCQRQHIFNCADKGLVLCVCECINNVLRGNVKLSPANKRELSQHKDILRKIVDRQTNVDKKRNLLIQKGGFLPALLAPVLSIAGGLISDLIGNLIKGKK